MCQKNDFARVPPEMLSRTPAREPCTISIGLDSGSPWTNTESSIARNHRCRLLSTGFTFALTCFRGRPGVEGSGLDGKCTIKEYY